jgi:raffinose/stachyose/melibiose transport system permease protein
MLPVVKLLSILNLTGTLCGGVTAYTGMGMAFSYFVMRGAAKSIPKEIEEAAMIDGCSLYGIFYRMILPLMVPTAVSVFILEVFWVWNDYNISIILLNTRFTKTVQVTIHALFAQTYSKWDIALPALVISMLPILVTNIVLQKKIFAGMTSGAIKG